MKIKIQKKLGFSIVEIMAVILVVSVGMISMMGLINQSIRVQRLNKHTLIAYQLAQEGIELVRVIRDDNWFSENPDDFTVALNEGSYCIDIDNINLNNPQNSPCSLYFDNNDFYVHSSSENSSPYSRLVTISEHEEDHAMKVEVEISWKDAGRDLQYNVETKLYDWY